MRGQTMKNSRDSRVDEILKELGMGHDEQARSALNAIAAYPAPVPSADQSKALAEAVRAARAASASAPHAAPAVGFADIMRSQLNIVGPRGLMFGAGVFAAAFASVFVFGNGLLAASAAVPVCAVLFLIYAFRADYYGMSEMESTCPVGPAQLALARLIIAGAVDVFVSVAAAVVVSTAFDEPFGLVLLSCVGPAVLLMGISLWTSLQWGPVMALVVALAVSGVGLLPSGVHSGVSPFAPVGAPLFLSWKIIYTAFGLALILISLLKQKHRQEGGQPHASDA